MSGYSGETRAHIHINRLIRAILTICLFEDISFNVGISEYTPLYFGQHMLKLR